MNGCEVAETGVGGDLGGGRVFSVVAVCLLEVAWRAASLCDFKGPWSFSASAAPGAVVCAREALVLEAEAPALASAGTERMVRAREALFPVGRDSATLFSLLRVV